nr:right-handed parallel beta-helix repeat-containing protein [Micromonospora sp. DSM 115978]
MAALVGVFSLLAVIGMVGRQAVGDEGPAESTKSQNVAAGQTGGNSEGEKVEPEPGTSTAPDGKTDAGTDGQMDAAPEGKTDAGTDGQAPDAAGGKHWDGGQDGVDGLGWDGKSGPSEVWHGDDWDGKGSDGKARDAEDVPCVADSLIAAITRANLNGGGHLKLAHSCVYTLTANELGNGLPPITQAITIKGEHATIVRAATTSAQFRIFNVASGGHLTLHKLTVTGGQTTGLGVPNGGGILVQQGGTAALNETTVTRNISGGSGGGIFNLGVTVVHRSTVSDNSAHAAGGGIGNGGNALLKVNESEISWNSAVTNGGGIADAGTSLINKTKILDNRALGNGGGIDANGSNTTVTYSLISGNSAANGGGLFSDNGSTVNLRHVTISRNRSNGVNGTGNGAGVSLNGNTQAVIENSAIVDNIASGNAGGIDVAASTLTLRDSKVSGNMAIGPTSVAGGIRTTGASTVTLVNTKVTDNLSTVQPGGIQVNVGGTLTLDNRSTVVANRPTNCVGSPVAVLNCFG